MSPTLSQILSQSVHSARRVLGTLRPPIVDDPIETEDDETAADVLLAARRWQIACERTGGRVSGAVKAAEAGLRTAVSRFGEDVPDLHEARRAARLASPLPAE